MSLLTLERVTKRFDGITAVDDVSFSIDRGHVVGFLGPNGAGKSTTMRMVTQVYEPDAGEIRLDGVPLSEAGRDAKRRLGFLPENNPLYGEMLVAEYLDFVARLRELRGEDRRRAIEDAVGATGLDSVYQRPIGELSKGFKQRVGFAAAILHRPDLLVLDEPTEGLDPNQRIEIRRLISELGRERTVILSTHVLPEVQHTCSRVVIINRGRIAADGAVDVLLSGDAGSAHVVVELRGSGAGDALAALAGVQSIEEQDTAGDTSKFRLAAERGRDIRADVFDLAKSRGWTLLELHREAETLEDLFRHLTGAEDKS